MKKGLISSLIVGLLVTVTLGLYTVVNVLKGGEAPFVPSSTTVNVAFRTGDTTNMFMGYSENNGTLTFTLPAEATNNPLKYNEETGLYEASEAGEVTAVLKLDEKGSTRTVKVKVYTQGVGNSPLTPYIIASAAHLVEFANIINEVGEQGSTGVEKPEYVELVSDIDLAKIDWKPIGVRGHFFQGNFEGNGFTIKNLSMNVNSSNYKDYVSVNTDGEPLGYIELGFFGRIAGSSIKDLNFENASVNVAREVYDLLKAPVEPGSEYTRIINLNIGTVAASARYSYITGCDSLSTISTRIYGFSYTNEADNVANGIGGVVGLAEHVQISNYSVKMNIINNIADFKESYIGGIAGYMQHYLSSNVPLGYKNTIDNCEASIIGSVVYNNQAMIGGLAGFAENADIINSNVKSVNVVDTTAINSIDFTLENVTTVAGGVGQIVSLPLTGESAADQDKVKGFISKVDNINVSGVNIRMVGGNAAGVVGYVGTTYTAGQEVTEQLVVSNSTVSGAIKGLRVGGFTVRVNPGATVEYTRAFDKAVVDVTIESYRSGGFAFANNGTIKGFEDENGNKTIVNVKTLGLGSNVKVSSENEAVEAMFNARSATYAAGLVARDYGYAEGVVPTISNFDVRFDGNTSINLAGIAFNLEVSRVENIDVNATFKSHTAMSTNGTNELISNTYMVAGAVCEAAAGVSIANINVIVTANKDIIKTLKYGAAFFGGIVARYLGDVDGLGLSIDNCEVSGDVYFNCTSEVVNMDSKEFNAFLAGGIIGAIAARQGANVYVDALGVSEVANTKITNNRVSNLTITADIEGSVMSGDGWRIRAIGAILGLLNTEILEAATQNLDLRTNTAENVNIVADEEVFAYQYANNPSNPEGEGVIKKITLGAGRIHVYGASATWNIGNTTSIQENADKSGIKYYALGEEIPAPEPSEPEVPTDPELPTDPEEPENPVVPPVEGGDETEDPVNPPVEGEGEGTEEVA